MKTILEVLNQCLDGGDVLFWGLTVLIVWCLIWRLFLGDWLFKHDVGTFWYAMYEAGPVGTFCLMVFFSFLLVLLITSLQAAFAYGSKMLVALAAFWSFIIMAAVFIFKHMKK